MTTAGAAARVRATTTISGGAMSWLVGALILGLLLLYFIGFDEGATSLLGNSMVLHEFVHDSRHFLDFPCH